MDSCWSINGILELTRSLVSTKAEGQQPHPFPRSFKSCCHSCSAESAARTHDRTEPTHGQRLPSAPPPYVVVVSTCCVTTLLTPADPGSVPGAGPLPGPGAGVGVAVNSGAFPTVLGLGGGGLLQPPGQGFRMLNVPSPAFPALSSQQRSDSSGRGKVSCSRWGDPRTRRALSPPCALLRPMRPLFRHALLGRSLPGSFGPSPETPSYTPFYLHSFLLHPFSRPQCLFPGLAQWIQ